MNHTKPTTMEQTATPTHEVEFSKLPYSRPDLDTVRQQAQELVSRIMTAPSASAVVDCIAEWNKLRSHLSTMQGLAEVHYTQNVADPSAKEEKEYFDKTGPSFTETQLTVARAIIQSPFRKEVEEAFGGLFLRRLEDSDRTFSPDIKDLLVRESELTNAYNEITASARLEFDGKEYNLSTIAKIVESLDRDVRHRAVKTLYGFLGTHAEELDRIYDELVKIRHEKAKSLGFRNYIEMRYTEMGRVDYNAEDVRVFRQQVLDHVVPLAARLREAQRNRLGYDSLSLSDEKLQFPDGNPVAKGEHDYIVEAAQKMYQELSPETDEFFSVMRSRRLMDLQSRANKATGGYCTSFPEYGVPFIFANFNQTSHDVEVLTHEAGHAFQAWRSRNFPVPEYLWPTAEACEIHSMAMEYLTWPWMHLFFGEQTDRFKFYHLQSAILFLPYGCLVDAFQHWVYENPEATPDQRLTAWKHLEKTFLPWRNTADVPEADAGRQWQFQRHIYESPFYYIDYTLASTCALQYWEWSMRDPRGAFESYLRVCDVGGSLPFRSIIDVGGLRSPFAPEVLGDIIDRCFSWLFTTYPAYL